MSVETIKDGAVRFPQPGGNAPPEYDGELVPGSPRGSDACFHCHNPLGQNQTVVTWSGAATAAWHVPCARDWLLAFARDVWQATREEARRG